MVENEVNKTDDLLGQDIVCAVCFLKVFTQDEREEHLSKVADPYHGQLLQEQAC